MISQTALVLGRIAREPAVQTTAVLASFSATDAGLRAVGITTHMNLAQLSDGLVSGQFWLVIGFATVFGALGGIVAELLSLHGNVELPHRHDGATRKRVSMADPRNEIDLGIFSRMALGAAAGVALLAVYTPDSAISLAANTLIAGSAATGVFRIVQRRVLLNAQPDRVRAAEPADQKPAPKTNLSVVGKPVIAEPALGPVAQVASS